MDNSFLVDSIETFHNDAGYKITLFLSQRKYLSETSIDINAMPVPLQNALLAWLEGKE